MHPGWRLLLEANTELAEIVGPPAIDLAGDGEGTAMLRADGDAHGAAHASHLFEGGAWLGIAGAELARVVGAATADSTATR